MAAPTRPITPPRKPSANESTFTRNLRFELAAEEGRGLLGSYAISFTLGILWLLLVWFGPHTTAPSLIAPPPPPVEVVLPPNLPPPTPIPPAPTPTGANVRTPAPGPTTAKAGPTGPQKGNPKQGRPGSRTESNKSGAIGDAFGTGSGSGSGGLVGDAGNILGGVAVSGSGGTGGGLGGNGGGGTGGKAVLGFGQGGQGSRTPGRGGIGGGNGTGGGGGGGIGGVGTGGGIQRVGVRVAPPSVASAPDIGKAQGNVDALGSFFRSHESALRFCYTEEGLKLNPNLAGSVTTSVSLTGSGSVTNVGIPSRSWGGAGASEAESCIRSKIRSWQWPAGNEGTYNFSISFTK